ncbi:MAG: hypothetical protein QXG71_01810, partial [Nanopusillaceae archaeon]
MTYLLIGCKYYNIFGNKNFYLGRSSKYIMHKKSISPLIATFILITLTVAIGAMVVAWGRQYV